MATADAVPDRTKPDASAHYSASDKSQSYKVLILAGDHAGPEVMAEALKVLDVISSARNVEFDLTHDLAGGCSIDKHDTAITDAVLQKATESDAVLFGSVGGPEWYACRPVVFHMDC